MLISEHIELVPIYVHSAIGGFVNSTNNKFSFTEEAYKNINQSCGGYLFIYSRIVAPSSLCIEINLSRNTKTLSPIDAAKTKQIVCSKNFNYFVWVDLWSISSNIVSFEVRIINTCALATIFSTYC